jgi:uncharacterized membrane protein YkvA (DUF1232 family)
MQLVAQCIVFGGPVLAVVFFLASLFSRIYARIMFIELLCWDIACLCSYYFASQIDFVPDFIPYVGSLDDWAYIVIAAFCLWTVHFQGKNGINY